MVRLRCAAGMSAEAMARKAGAAAGPVAGPARIVLATALDAPVPPSPVASGVVRPVRAVMSAFEPLAAAPRLTRAPAAVLAPVPPLRTPTMPETVVAVAALREVLTLIVAGKDRVTPPV